MDSYVARGVSPQTADRVGRELERWGSWLKRRRPKPRLEQVDVALIQRYIQVRTAFRSKATVAAVMGAMRGMGQFLTSEGLWVQNPLRWMRGPKLDSRLRVPRRVGRESLKRLWQQAASDRQGYYGRLWLTILSVLYGTGIRRGELERLNLEHWRRDESLLLIDGRKTSRQRQVSVPEVVWRCLEAYLPQRQNQLQQQGVLDESALFVNRWGRRLTGAAISGGIRRLAQRSGVGKVTLHQFRHTCASDLLEDGVRLPEVQAYLGHQAISTTVRYLQIADPQRHEAVRRHPINQLLEIGEQS
jgi:site-specific recombinase XerD